MDSPIGMTHKGYVGGFVFLQLGSSACRVRFSSIIGFTEQDFVKDLW